MKNISDTFSEISDRYQILAELGKGGMGIVYRAHDSFLDIDVAIKLLKGELSDRDVVRFQNEAKTHGKLKDEHIAQVLDFGQLKSTGAVYLIMEYVSSTTLEDYIEREGPFEVSLGLEIFAQILQGIKHAHEHNVIHQDIKPSNILLRIDDENNLLCKIVDFGIAKTTDQEETSSPTKVVGSPFYMSPEQIDGIGIDERSDIYALGCLLHKILKGEVPFKGDTKTDTYTLHKTASFPGLEHSPSENSHLEELNKIISKCLAKAKTERYQSVSELLVDVENLEDQILREKEEQELKDAEPGKPERFKITFPSMAQTRIWFWPILIVFIIVSALVIVYTYIKSSEIEKKSIVYNESVKVEQKISRSRKKERLELVKDGFKEVQKFSAKQVCFINVPDAGKVWMVSVNPNTSDEDLKSAANTKHTEFIWVEESRIKGSGFQAFSKRQVISLTLLKSPVNDDGLKTISGLSSLLRLRIHFNNDVTDSGISYVKNLKRLKLLSLTCKNVTDKALDSISTMTNLEVLTLLKMPQITDKGLNKILKMKNLTGLNITGTSISSGSLYKLKKLKKLNFLNVSDLSLEDKDIKSLAKLKLNSLVLNGNEKITNKGISYLSKNKHLKKLRIARCPKVDVSTLKLPGCAISRREADQFILKPKQDKEAHSFDGLIKNMMGFE